MKQDTGIETKGQECRQQAEVMSGMCYQYVLSLLYTLHQKLDRRLVQTFLCVC